MHFDRLALTAAVCALLLPLGAAPSLAQSSYEALEQEIQQQRAELEQQIRRLEELEKKLQQAKAAAEESEPDLADKPAPSVATAGAQPKTKPDTKKPVQVATAAPTTPREPANRYEKLRDDDFLKSVPLFGSDWRSSLGGYVKLDMVADFSGTGDPYQLTTATIPVHGAANSPQSGGYTQVHVRESRFNFELRNTSKDEPFTRVFYEMDWFDESSTSPRLRHAYVQYGNLIVGQTWTTLSELRSLPFLVDFSYGDALYGGRAALVRWQQQVNEEFSWAVGLEDFTDDAIENPSDLAGTARSMTPLLAARGTYDIGRALFTLGGSVAQLRWDGDGMADDEALQWALMFGTRIYLDENRRHYFGLDSSFGDGSAANIISLAEGRVPGAVLGPDGRLHTLYAWSLAPSFQFNLSDKLSTNLSYAWSEVESSSLRGPDDMKGGYAAHINLIYRPIEALRFGGEYMYGNRRNQGGADGGANRLQFMVMYSF